MFFFFFFCETLLLEKGERKTNSLDSLDKKVSVVGDVAGQLGESLDADVLLFEVSLKTLCPVERVSLSVKQEQMGQCAPF